MTGFVLACAMVAALAAAAFFAGMETGVLALSPTRLAGLVRMGDKKAISLAESLEDKSRMLTTLLVGNNLAGSAFSTASAVAAVEWFADDGAWVRWTWSAGSALAMVFCGEYLPKLVFAIGPLKGSMEMAGAYRAAAWAFKPVVEVFAAFTRRLFGEEKRRRDAVLSRDGLLDFVDNDGEAATRLSGFERAMIEKVLELQESFAEDLMHREQVPEGVELRIPATMRADDILPVMRKSKSRVAAVYDAESFKEVGWIGEEDILAALTDFLKTSNVENQ
ncbi:MAG: DUF21 domain-containing protein [Kiritimatiellae bacterium]|nr:DUF21 domain-containing protein [Kiritimatiellia bacterium]